MKSEPSMIFLQLPLEKTCTNIKLVNVRNKFLFESKEDMHNLYKQLFRWFSKNSKLSELEYSSYINARLSHENEEFGIDNNPYSKSMNTFTKSLLGAKETKPDLDAMACSLCKN